MLRLIIAAVVLIAAAISYFTLSEENPVTGEEQRIALSPEEEVALGLQAAPEMVQRHGGMHPDPRVQQLIDGVGERLLAAVRAMHATDQLPYPFEFSVLADGSTVNAFALPGGQIFITDGLLSRFDSEDQLAGVLGHEIGHVVHRHSAEQLAKARLSQGLAGAAVIAAGDLSAGQLAQVVSQLMNMRYGREDELESDTYGVQLLHAAGYPPEAMLEVMEILHAGADSRPPEFLSTHPDPGNRMAHIRDAIDALP